MTQPSALRERHYGALQPMQEAPHPSDSAWVRPDGEPSLAAGTTLLVGCILIMVALFQTLEWILA